MPGLFRFSAGRLPLTDFCARRSFGSPQFPSYPFEHMPWSKTPVVTCTLAMTHAGLLPSAKSKASAFPSSFRELSLRTTTIHFSGLNTEPAPLLHPAPDSRCRVYLWISLLTRWLTFRQIGLSLTTITYWVTISNFTSLWSLPTIRASLGARISIVSSFLCLDYK